MRVASAAQKDKKNGELGDKLFFDKIRKIVLKSYLKENNLDFHFAAEKCGLFSKEDLYEYRNI